MSKAFTKETEHDDDELPAELKVPQGSKNYMTPQGWQRMKNELYELVHKERPHVTQVVNWAASNGDRSENADYQYGKRRLREIDRRIRFLSKRLENAEVIDPETRETTDQVFFSATVTYLREDGREETVSIVGIDETNFQKNHISWTSPVARALLKAREGDVVTLRTPQGLEELEIIAVEYCKIES
ncbi:transcription elongation factor GreB [Chitinibacter tainanensis]|uniref:transcription elongation factor GreB n=1 Tax=Chitinibacter tainanensis TaxID=230667 RepID=UPI00235392C6|nr:transcription elongation factor GreB [Chitinibacter tainanensis]